ncbi:uncharacterized protein METZ01_LOCUS259956, partial [marine metagenome]
MPKSDTVWTYNKSGEGLMSRTITKDEYG